MQFNQQRSLPGGGTEVAGATSQTRKSTRGPATSQGAHPAAGTTATLRRPRADNNGNADDSRFSPATMRLVTAPSYPAMAPAEQADFAGGSTGVSEVAESCVKTEQRKEEMGDKAVKTEKKNSIKPFT